MLKSCASSAKMPNDVNKTGSVEAIDICQSHVPSNDFEDEHESLSTLIIKCFEGILVLALPSSVIIAGRHSWCFAWHSGIAAAVEAKLSCWHTAWARRHNPLIALQEQ